MATDSQPTNIVVDPGPEVTIRQLLDRKAQLQDQHAEVQAQLAALLPAKYGTNIKLELVMLRHKLHALQAYCALHRMATLPFFMALCRSPPVQVPAPPQLNSSLTLTHTQPLQLITLLTIYIPTILPPPVPFFHVYLSP